MTDTVTVSITLTTGSSIPTITSLLPNSANPGIKQFIKISGSGFGTVASDLKVYLQNSTGNFYNMRIINATDTEVFAGLPGGIPGNFKLVLYREGFGNAIAGTSGADNFVY